MSEAGDGRDGVAARVAMAAVGLVFALPFGVLAIVTAATAFTPLELAHTARSLGMAALLGAIAALGVGLVLRAVRGGRDENPAAETPPSRASEPQQPSRLPWLLPVATIAIGWGAAGNLSRFLALEGPATARNAWQLLAIWLAWCAHVAVHEVAHAVAAAAVGARVHEVWIGPVRLHRGPGGWRLAFRRSGLVIGGRVMAQPPAGGWTRAGFIAHVAAGPLVAVGLAVASGVTLFVLHPAGVAARLLAAFAATAVLGLVPWRWRRPGTDLQLIRDALRGFEFTPVGRVVMWHIGQGRRAREWPHGADEIAAAAKGMRDQGFGLLLAAVRDLDGGDAARARQRLGAIAADPALRDAAGVDVELQLAMMDALLAGDPAAARARLAGERLRNVTGYAALAVAAVEVAEGNAADARKALEAWRAHVAAQPHPAHARGGNEWAEDLVEARLGAAEAERRPTA